MRTLLAAIAMAAAIPAAYADVGDTHLYPKELVERNIAGCLKTGDTAAHCQCYIDTVQETLTLRAYAYLEWVITHKPVPEWGEAGEYLTLVHRHCMKAS